MKINHQITRLFGLFFILLAGLLRLPVAYASQAVSWGNCRSVGPTFLAGSWYRQPDGTRVDIPQTDPIMSILSPLPANSPPNVFMRTTWGFLKDTCSPSAREAFAMMPHADNVRKARGHAVLKIEATEKENKVRYTYGRAPPAKSPFHAVVTVEIYPAVASMNCKPKYQRDDSIPALIGYDFRNCGGMGVNMTLEFIQTTETCSVNATPVGSMAFPWSSSGFQGELNYPAKPLAQQYHDGTENNLLGIRKGTSHFTAQADCRASSPPPPPPPPPPAPPPPPPPPPAPVTKCEVAIKSSVKRR